MTSNHLVADRPRLVTLVLSALAAVMLALGVGGAAYAHSALVSASPAAGETVTALPTKVVLTFNEDVAPGLAVIRVTDGEGLAVATGEAVVSGTSVTQKLVANLHAGSYQVAFKVTSADGHPISDAYSFVIPASVAPAPTSDQPSDPVAVPPANGSSSSTTAAAQTSSAPSATAAKPAVAPRSDAQKSSGHMALLIAMGVAALAVAGGAAALLAQRRRDPESD